MLIDDQIEDLARKALNAVVKRDPAKLKDAFAAFPADAALIDAVRLATAVSWHVLCANYGPSPSAYQIDSVADTAAEMESWSGLTAAEFKAFLTKLRNGENAFDSFSTGQIALISFVLAGNLLASCGREDEPWFQHLDRIEAALETSPR